MTKLEELNAEQKKLEARLEEIKRERVALASAVTLGPVMRFEHAPRDGSWVLARYSDGAYVALRWRSEEWRNALDDPWGTSPDMSAQVLLPREGGAA